MADIAHDPVAQFEMRDTRTELRHHTRDLAAGREGKLGLHLVSALDDQRVEEVETDRLDRDQHLAGTGIARGDVFDRQTLRSAKGLAQDRSHDLLLLVTMRTPMAQTSIPAI